MNLVDHMQFQLDSSFDQCIGLIHELLYFINDERILYEYVKA